ncbi:MAG: DevR family CRISPR-associated autoregulator [Candidatus Aerophobetes bacterium]|nr:DevR family CRISPR-associated autoregulator [Candidatus Aerophobetes bacterium]
MLKYVTFGVKAQLNVHDLNNEAVAGDVQDIRVIEFLDENKRRREAPAVSGRMLKHWHYEIMRQLGLEHNLPFCDACRIGEPVRPSVIVDDNGQKKLSHQEAIDKGTGEVVKSCIVCDIHGYLAAIGATSERRSSRVMFSWFMPVLGSESGTKQVIHSRVKSGMDFKEAALTSQMPYYKSYASGVYAFVSALDTERIGLVESNLGDDNPYVIEDSDRNQRTRVAIEAYRYLISGQMGASLSHAIPHTEPIEVLLAYSETSPIPFPISPIYKDYIEEYKGLIPDGTTILFWNQKGEKIEGVTMKSTINKIFEETLKKL